MIYAAAYVVGIIVVAAALQGELERKPKATAAVILLWPIVLPIAMIAAICASAVSRLRP